MAASQADGPPITVNSARRPDVADALALRLRFECLAIALSMADTKKALGKIPGPFAFSKSSNQTNYRLSGVGSSRARQGKPNREATRSPAREPEQYYQSQQSC